MCPYAIYKQRMKDYFMYKGMDEREACTAAKKHAEYIEKMGFLLIQKREVRWNPYNKVVQNHRTGDIHHKLTNIERKKRGLFVPWTPIIAEQELKEAPVL